MWNYTRIVFLLSSTRLHPTIQWVKIPKKWHLTWVEPYYRSSWKGVHPINNCFYLTTSLYTHYLLQYLLIFGSLKLHPTREQILRLICNSLATHDSHFFFKAILGIKVKVMSIIYQYEYKFYVKLIKYDMRIIKIHEVDIYLPNSTPYWICIEQ